MASIKRNSVDLNFSTIAYRNVEAVWAKSEADGRWHHGVVVGKEPRTDLDEFTYGQQRGAVYYRVIFQKETKKIPGETEVLSGSSLMPLADPVAVAKATEENLRIQDAK